MSYKVLRKNIFDCAVCPTPCDGISKKVYAFLEDAQFSENVENHLIERLNAKYTHLTVRKCPENAYPDLEVAAKNAPEEVLLFIEVKVQARTFMRIAEKLPASGLFPSETVALNLSDLERYFEIAASEKKRLIVLWVLKERPCILQGKRNRIFFAEIEDLERIRKQDTANTRRFRRQSGEGDVVAGVHKGVVVNYHFSINELQDGLPVLDCL